MESIEVKAYKCSKCGCSFISKEAADDCCKPKFCEDCGCKMDSKWYYTVCESCKEKREYNKATKMTYEEYIKLHKDDYYTLCYGGDNYYTDIDDLMESLDEEQFENIKYVNGVYKERVELEADSIIEDIEVNSNFEDLEVDKSGVLELEGFLKQWNKKYGTDSYGCDNNIIVLIDDELKEGYL